jgi:hypothetical protein
MIRIIQTSGVGIIRGEKQAIISALEHPHTKIHVLLANPNSTFLEEVEQMEGANRKNNIGPEIRAGEALLREYIDEAQNKFGAKGNIGKIYFGYYNTHFRLSILLCDNSWGWITLIMPPMRAVESVSVELKKFDASLIDDCIRHFDSVWLKSSVYEIKP